MKSNKKEQQKEEKNNTSMDVIEKSNENGTIKITEEVILSTIKKAICSVDGVTRLSGSSFIDNITNMISNQRFYDRAINITRNKNVINVEAKVNVSYGGHIPEIATNIQNTVRREVKRILGLDVSEVNVIIQGIENKEENQEENEGESQEKSEE